MRKHLKPLVGTTAVLITAAQLPAIAAYADMNAAAPSETIAQESTKKKVIITESMAQQLMIEEIMSKADVSSILNSREFKDAVSKSLKDNKDFDRDFEKKVKKIVADAVKTLFRGLWERNNFWAGLINNQ